MEFLINNWMLIAIAVASAAMLFWPVLGGAGGPGSVSAQEAVQLINREKAAVVDVCEPQEFAAGHVVGARNIPMGQLEGKLPTAVKNKDVPLILVCHSGARSMRAVHIAKKAGFTRVHSLSGGMGAWRAASLPVEKA